jgi:hypothetical protein
MPHLERFVGSEVQTFWQPLIAACFIRFNGLIGLISSIGSGYNNQFNQ